jgi:outer membrane receptor protein involved in Fe transport
MKKLYYLLIYLLPLQIFAQTTSIEGIIVDNTNNFPLEFASVSIYTSSDSNLVNGAITDINGKFLIKGLNSGSFYLKVQFLGYNTKNLRNLNITGKNLNIGLFQLSPDARFLNEVKVVGQQIQSVNKLDKQVYKADQFAAAKGGTAIDALKNLPSVAVNGEGEISVRGSTGFLVLINGKPVQGDAQTILSQIPANTLENLEFITAPSAKYDADGKGGILNITTKKGINNGVSVLANLQGGLLSTTDYGNIENQQRYGGDITFNFIKNQWDITTSINYLRNDNAGFREGDVFTINNGLRTNFPSVGERSFDKYNYGGRFNIGFNPNKNNAFSFGFFAGYKFQDRLADINYNNIKTNASEQVVGRKQYFNSNLQNKQGDFILGNFDYTHIFGNKSTLSFATLYEYDKLYGSTINRNIEGVNIPQNTLSTYKNPLNGLRAKVDYNLNIGKVKLETGYQYRMDKQNGGFIYSESYFGGPFNVIPLFTGEVKSKNDIHAVYGQFSGVNKNLEYVGGLRYENAKRDLVVSSITKDFKLNFNNLFPSASILYSLEKGYKLKAGVSRRVQRNNNFELNPIQEREHSETLEQGDPNLLPEFIYLAEAGLIKSFDKGSFFTTLYFQDIKNPIQRVNSIFADTILNRIFTNAGKAQKYGVELGTNIQATKAWNLYLGANLYQYNLSGYILGNTLRVNNDGFVYSFNFNSNINLSNAWSMQGNVNYLSNRPTAQGEDSRFLSPNLSFKKTFLEGRLTALLQWQNIDLGMYQSNVQRITTAGLEFFTTTNYIYETDVFMLNFGFNLNKLTRKLKLPGSEFGDKEF